MSMSELRYRRASAWEYDLILREAEKYGELKHHTFAIVEGKFRDVYAVNERVWREIENLKIRPYAYGTFVGTIKVDKNLVEKFYPNVEFFYFVDIQKNYAVLSPKAGFLFTTGKDVPRSGVRKYSWQGTKKLVVFDENGIILGIGRINPEGRNKFILNVTDVGEFLRRKR
ncbi:MULTISPECIES: PUA domain-containing protein [unclassified Thermococcus]|uniref:PUA domain-containing protein n=1 Tax=unclassified Thermococcus TaxID=2627626 RepID=UPI00351BA15C